MANLERGEQVVCDADVQKRLLEDLIFEHQANITKMFADLEVSAMQDMLNLILNCKGVVFFCGVGKSGIIGQKLAATMTSTGTKAMFMCPLNCLHGDIGVVGSEDVVVLMSKSGNTEELLRIIPALQAKKATLVAWVSNPSSKLAKACGRVCVNPCGSELCPYNLAPTTSTASQLIYGDLLAVAAMKIRSFSNNDFALNHPAGAIGKKLTLTVRDVMVTGSQLPKLLSTGTLRDALRVLTQQQSNSLVVVGEDDKAVGVFDDTVLEKLMENNTLDLTASITTLMTTHYTPINPSVMAVDALKMAEKRHDACVLPVLDKGVLVGLVRRSDLQSAGL